MKKVWIFCLIFSWLLASCTSQEPLPTSLPQTPTADPFALPMDRGTHFAASGVCATCHKDMMDGDGNDVSLDAYWRGTMMANSARDPYWQASVRGEVLSNPGYDEIIQDKCTTCHTPMARTSRAFEGEPGILLDDGFLNPENDLHVLAMDGISCTLCHQIDNLHFGEQESYDGGYVIDADTPLGERVNYGPYDVAEESVVLMRSASGFVPEMKNHIQSSEMCGTCHTLYTPTIDNNGEIVGIFPEQMPYIEWLASSYADQKSCQDCHMPEATGEVVLSVTGTPGRPQFSLHSFAGGNTYALSLLHVYGGEMGATASKDQISAALKRAGDQLKNQTAKLQIQELVLDGTTLQADVLIENQVGHKFPSGFPSRRVWIHLMVQDSKGDVIFESGRWDDGGGLHDNNNDLDAAAFEQHYQVIEDPSEVQIYEAIMGDVDGAVTTTLLRGSVYLKDNRLLPAGFDKNSVSDDIAVRGAALDDVDFQAGRDSVRYLVTIDPAAGPFTVTAELLYQSVAYRWAQNLGRYDAPEPRRFLSYYESVPNQPVLVSSVSVTTDG